MPTTDAPASPELEPYEGDELTRGEAVWLAVRVGLSVWALWVVICLAAITFLAVAVGMRPYVINSGSMAPLISRGDIVLTVDPPVEVVLAPPTVATFRTGRGQLVTHRIAGLDDDTGAYLTKGDANTDVDSSPLPRDGVLGVGRLLVPKLGLVKVWADAGQWGALALAFAAAVLAMTGARGPSDSRPDARPSDAAGTAAAPSALRVTAQPSPRWPRWFAASSLVLALLLLVVVGWVAVASAAAFNHETSTSGSAFAAAMFVPPPPPPPPPPESSTSWYLRNTLGGGDTVTQGVMPISSTATSTLPDVSLPNYSTDVDETSPGRRLNVSGVNTLATWSSGTVATSVTYNGTSELFIDTQRPQQGGGRATVTATLVAISSTGVETVIGTATAQTPAANPGANPPNERLTFAIPTSGTVAAGGRLELRLTTADRPVRLRYDTTDFPARLTLPGALSVQSSGTAVAGRWTFAGGSLAPVYSPTSASSSFGLSSITAAGPQVSPFGVMNNDGGTLSPDVYGYPNAPQLRFGPPAGTTTPAAAVANASYVNWTVTAPPNGRIAFSELTFEAARGGDTTPRGLVLRASHDSYGTDLFNQPVAAVRPTMAPNTVDLAAVAPIVNGQSRTFRLYVYGPASNSTIEVDGLELVMAVTVHP